MSKTTTNTINFNGKTLSEIRRPSTPKYLPLYEKRDKFIFNSDQEYANNLVKYIQKSEEKLSRKDTIRRLKSIKRYFNDKTAKRIFNRLISDVRCLDRIVFVDDGSYRTHRIWYGYRGLAVDIADGKSDFDIRSMYPTTNGKEAMKAFQLILKRYEKIFIQV
mgnify:CR=1 FL=1